MAVTANLPHLPTSIDMASLSHSDLHSLSLLSNSPLPHPYLQNDAVISSKLPSFFNESASTNRQTYFDSPHRRRSFSFLERERSESNLIVDFLKKYLKSENSALEERKTKRKRNRKKEIVEIVNRNGVVVDLAALEREGDGGGGPFAEELRRRAAGREKEEELLEIMAEMEGEWCSRRKKRRVVDACLLGDALPVGWKLIIALRRKGGKFSPYCRRYISPTGEQLSSCKEVSSYLQSYFGIIDTKLLRDSKDEFQQLQRVDSGNLPSLNLDDGNSLKDVSNATTFVPNAVEHEKGASVMGIDNLPDVQVCDLYECHSCNISFDVKDKYLQHLLSFHQKTTRRYRLSSSVGDEVIIKDGKYESQRRTRRYRLGSSVGDGVIIKDGKYECQFCHKVFEERRRYLGHVGNHVKGSIRRSENSLVQATGSARSPCMDRLPTTISNSKMDALIEIAQSSIQDISPSVLGKDPSSVNKVDQLSTAENSKIVDANCKTERNPSSCLELDMEKHGGEGRTTSEELNPLDKVSRISSTCPNGIEEEKNIAKDKTLSKEFHLPCNKVSEISRSGVDINDSNPCLDDEKEMEKDSGELKSSFEVLIPQDKMRDLSMADVNFTDLTSCPNELEMKKDGRQNKTSSAVLNLHANVSEISIAGTETKEQAFTCNTVDSEKESCFDLMMMPDAEAGIQGKNASINSGHQLTTAEDDASADELKGVFNIDHLWCNEKPSDLDIAGEKIQSKCVDKPEPKHAKGYKDSEIVTVSGAIHASGYREPQISLNSLSPFDEIFGKAGQNIMSLDQNIESVIGLEYMKLDVIEPQVYKYNAMGGEDSISLSEVSMDLENNSVLELGLDACVKSQSEFPQEMVGTSLTTTVCVWCGVEFSHEMLDIEPQPDSVGFMCPACRAKISKQFNELESNFSLNPHYF